MGAYSTSFAVLAGICAFATLVLFMRSRGPRELGGGSYFLALVALGVTVVFCVMALATFKITVIQ